MSATPTTAQVAEAYQRVARFTVNAKTIVVDPSSKAAGFLGEIVARDFLGYIETPGVNWNYDLISQDGARLEVKTKRTRHAPRPLFSCGVSTRSDHQRPDYYVFMFARYDLSELWFIGVVSFETFRKESQIVKEGESDGRGDPNWRASADQRYMTVQDVERLGVSL